MEVELSSGRITGLYPIIGPNRGVVMVTDLAGRRPLFEELAERLSVTHGWNVIVIDPLEGAAPTVADPEQDRSAREAAMSKLDDDEVIADLVEAADRLEVDPVSIVGFGVGGMYVYKAAAVARFDRLVSFCGMARLPTRWRGPGQREPFELLRHMGRPGDLLSIVGTEDAYTPRADIDELIELGVRVARFEGAAAGFALDPALASYRPGDAQEAWTLAAAHLGQKGGL